MYWLIIIYKVHVYSICNSERKEIPLEKMLCPFEIVEFDEDR